MRNQNGALALGTQSIIVIVCLAFFAVVCSPGGAVAADKVIKLKYSSAYMPFEPPNIQANHCLDLVEKKTNGKVKIERFMGGALGGPDEQLGLCSYGAVDIIALHTDQYTQQLPLHQVLNTEQFVSGAQGLANITALTQEIPETKAMFDQEQEKNDIKILSWHVQGVTGLNLGFEAKNLADIKGKKLNVITGFHRKVFKDFGWIPVNVQIPELYEALSRGVIDGIFMATAAVIPLKWYEITKCHLKLGENTVLSQAITLNLKTWKKLPEDVRQAFIEASRETAEWSIGGDMHMVGETYKKFEAANVPIYELPHEEYLEFFTVFSKYSTDEYLANARKQKVEDQAKKIMEYFELMKWGKWKK